MLEAVRILGLERHTRFYQASTSEMFGKVQEVPQRETTPFYPRSPYGVAKLYAHWICVNYREAYGLYACSGILFNHESPLRGETFVSRKITRALSRISVGLQDTLHLGNLDARRDWGHARDYVRAQWLMLQQPQADDYVVATGEQHSVRDFVVLAGRYWAWTSSGAAGAEEVGRSPQRPGARARGPALLPADRGGLSARRCEQIRDQLGWRPEITFDALVREMIEADLALGQARCVGGEGRLSGLPASRVIRSVDQPRFTHLRCRTPRHGGCRGRGCTAAARLSHLLVRPRSWILPSKRRYVLLSRTPPRGSNSRGGARRRNQGEQYPSRAVHLRQSADPGECH
jgi:nucleoside-diphosphate-sugar epimerase